MGVHWLTRVVYIHTPAELMEDSEHPDNTQFQTAITPTPFVTPSREGRAGGWRAS